MINIGEFHMHAAQIKPSEPSGVYLLQWTGLSLVQIIACRLFGANP